MEKITTMGSLDGYTIGFIGLGMMGKYMAQNLKSAGANLIIHNRSQRIITELKREGMRSKKTPAEITRTFKAGDAVILMLPDTKALEDVLSGPDGLICGLQKNCLVIDMGTSSVSVTRLLAKEVATAGSHYIDAPVSGGTSGAKEGTLKIMAGGESKAIALAKPIFKVLGKKLTHVGPVGTGQIAKTANQIIVGLNIGAIAEALVLAKKAGADPAQVCKALTGGFADSRALELHGQRMICENFEPGARSTIQRKDLDQALELAKDLGLDLPATSLGRDLYDKLINAGHGNLDHSALIKAIDPDQI
jgi:3-hydroxyisobutyrate dehydrogenase-like beta-hydroxyacid dehydrogenase